MGALGQSQRRTDFQDRTTATSLRPTPGTSQPALCHMVLPDGSSRHSCPGRREDGEQEGPPARWRAELDEGPPASADCVPTLSGGQGTGRQAGRWWPAPAPRCPGLAASSLPR